MSLYLRPTFKQTAYYYDLIAQKDVKFKYYPPRPYYNDLSAQKDVKFKYYPPRPKNH